MEKNNANYEEIREILPELLEKYLIIKNLSQNRFSKLIGCQNSIICKIIKKQTKIGKKTEQKLLKYFKVATIEELVTLLEKKTKDYEEKKKKNQEYSDQVSDQVSDLIQSYILSKGITPIEFSKSIKYTYGTVDYIIRKKRKISDGMYQELYDYFKVKPRKIEKLISVLKEEIEKNKSIIQENENKKITLEKYNMLIIELIKEYLELDNISKKDFYESMELSENIMERIIIKRLMLHEKTVELLLNYFHVTKIEDLIIKLVTTIAQSKGCVSENKINKRILFKIVDVSSLISDEYIIFMLLFGEKSCSIDIISELLKIDKKYISDIYTNYLNKYREELERKKSSNNIMKFEAD